MKNSIFARFARAFFIFWHFEDVPVLSTTWNLNDLFCSCVDDASIWWHIFNFVLLTQKRWFQFNSRIVRTHFATAMTLNNCDIIEETRSYMSLSSTSSLLKLPICPIGRQSDKSVTLINQTASSQIGHLFSRKPDGIKEVDKNQNNHNKRIIIMMKLIFQVSALRLSPWQRANARHVSFVLSSRR